jgi:hypothetical protein
MSLFKYLTLLALPLMFGFGHAQAEMPKMMYRQVMVDGVNITYREIGNVNCPGSAVTAWSTQLITHV